MDEELRTHVCGRYNAGASYADIGREMGVTKATAYDLAHGKPVSLAACNLIRSRLGWPPLGELVLVRPDEEVRKRRRVRKPSPSEEHRRRLQAELRALGLTLNQALEIAIDVSRRGGY